MAVEFNHDWMFYFSNKTVISGTPATFKSLLDKSYKDISYKIKSLTIAGSLTDCQIQCLFDAPRCNIILFEYPVCSLGEIPNLKPIHSSEVIYSSKTPETSQIVQYTLEPKDDRRLLFTNCSTLINNTTLVLSFANMHIYT
jgi:hypothetical protein